MHRYALVLALLMLVAATASCQRNQEMIDRVAAREVQEAKASWWGFDAEDATACLQAAIDSGVARLIVEDMGTAWIVTPIRLASNQEIVFEEGVEVLAKRGEFQSTNATLVTASNVENVTLTGYGATFRMWQEDYDNPDLYQRAEWRHCVSIRSSSNINVYGLTLRDSGGDGIYLGTATQWVTNLNIHIKDVVCDNNYRQGISVITAENLLIEDTIMRNTSGTPPQAGIDFEPNHPEERLVNVVMRNCLSENNNSYGYVLAISPLTADSEPLSMRFENCRSVGDAGPGFAYSAGATIESAVGGLAELINCSFEGSGGAGISVTKPAEQGLVRFENCQVINCAIEMPGISPIMFNSRRGADAAVGGVEFDGVGLTDAVDRAPMGYNDQGGGIALADITGTLIIDRDEEPRTIELTEELLAQWMPVIALKDIPRLSLEGMELVPLALDSPAAEGAEPNWPRIRKKGEYVLYAQEGDDVSFTVSHQQVGRYAGKDMPVPIGGPSGETVHEAVAPFQEETVVSFTAPETGVYRIALHAGANRFQLLDPSHPLNVSGENGPIYLIQSAGDLIFYVPAGTTEFGVRVSGEGPGEAIKAALLDPAGEVVEEVDNQFQTHQFEVELDQPSEGEVWTLRLSSPSGMTWEDHFVDLRGVPPLLAPAGTALIVPTGE